MEHSTRHTVIFTTLLCVVFSLAVSAVSVALRERQEENKTLDRIKNVLVVAGKLEPGESLGREEMRSRFESALEPRLVDLQTGLYVDGDPMAFDQRKAAKNPDTSRPAPNNASKVRRLPDQALVYLIRGENGAVAGYILPVEGMGLWSTLYGYLAIEPDTNTVRGITFYQHGETPGLGGEVDNPRWKALWPGRKVFDRRWEPRLAVIKGQAGPVEQDPYRVDGLSGATITSNGVTNLIRFWLGENGFGPYLAEMRRQES